MDQLRELMTLKAVADYLHVTPEYVSILTRRGDLPCVRLGRRVLVYRDDLAAYVESRRAVGAEEGLRPWRSVA